MKKFFQFALLGLFLFSIVATTPSCNRGTGCPSENLGAKTSRKGKLSKKKGSTNLFPKNMRNK